VAIRQSLRKRNSWERKPRTAAAFKNLVRIVEQEVARQAAYLTLLKQGFHLLLFSHKFHRKKKLLNMISICFTIGDLGSVLASKMVGAL
jgi:hypothetical protein